MTEPEATPQPRWRAGLAYGLPGLPLAFVALPLYVTLPHYYVEGLGLSLASMGVLLLLVRVLDGVTDPLMGLVADGLLRQRQRRLVAAMLVVAIMLALGFAALFLPPVAWLGTASALWWWALAALLLTCVAYSILVVLHQAWAVRLGGGDRGQSRWVAWREGAALCGVILASLLPTWVGMSGMAAIFITVLGLALLAWWLAPRPASLGQGARPQSLPLATWRLAWRSSGFRRLFAVFVINGIAAAIPATLLLFYVHDRLQAAGWEGAFLAIYFLAGGISLPFWVRCVARLGLTRTWALGMALAIVAFAGAAALSAGDAIWFLGICLASGLALGADLALPATLLARVIRLEGHAADAEGAYFGWWNGAAKLNLALAAGLSLPLLQILGYVPGAQEAGGLMWLALMYGGLPCLLKLLALLLLWRWRGVWDSAAVRAESGIPSGAQQSPVDERSPTPVSSTDAGTLLRSQT